MMTDFETATIGLAVISATFGSIGWLLVRLLNHQAQLTKDKEAHRRELNEERDKTAESKYNSLIDKIDGLVSQVSNLFRDQEIVLESVSQLAKRVGKSEKKIAEHCAKCAEREKVLTKVADRQDEAIRKYDKFMLQRNNDPTCPDRTDREN